ncbi:MAG: LacI family DNA-binding transcriptional regulator [Rubrivivax sp.]|nr:LacI family DNA-binding transcriptional regulator [Rubrivivax sp.]
MPNPLTITQIAEAAGVSTATVDRVLNNRPGVNPGTVQKVRDAVTALGGGAPVRGRPRSTSNYRFGFVLPATRRGFFDAVDRVIAQAAGEFRHQHITEITHRLPVEAAPFAAELAKLTDLDGVALLAPDLPPVKLAINELVRAGVHVVTLFSDVPGSMRETTIGADNRAAGRTAGLLLGRSLPRSGGTVAALLSPATRYAAEIDRRIGFQQVLEERFPLVHVLRLFELPESDDEAFEYTRAALAPAALADMPGGAQGGTQGGTLGAVYNVGPASFGIARALAAHGHGDEVMFAAHDLLDVHRSMLISGTLSYVLHQDLHYCVTAAARVLRALCDGVRGALAVGHPRVEILTVENLA